ncbi:hypothetical protein [Catenulispora subtropica]|uniref:Bacterial bifunctional deaminase-reductase C-terminal domain-containing protein n=1 Tax=Catenulispora subtropica TaxID=450798 RepID=A0ABN2QTX4_9ACTN
MTFVTANMSMSLDGFVSHPTDGVGTLFGWYGRGDVVVETTDDERWELKEGAEVGGGKSVVIGSADLTRQALNAGLLDELTVDLVAAMLGEGIRFFDNLKETPYELEQTSVRPGNGVVHLAYKVVKR